VEVAAMGALARARQVKAGAAREKQPGRR
jgi:hypothetical protein